MPTLYRIMDVMHARFLTIIGKIIAGRYIVSIHVGYFNLQLHAPMQKS